MRILIFLISFTLYSSDALSAPEKIKLPEGFKIEVFAEDLGTPRFMAFSPDGTLFATIISSGKVVALPDKNKDGKADKTITFLDGLNYPHGIDFYEGYLYVAETHQVARFKYDGIYSEPGEKSTVVPDLPTGGHFTRSVKIGPDGKLYVSISSSCNVCQEEDKRRAAIMRYNLNGTDGAIFAKGLRNAVGIIWHTETHELWATDNGRDWLGDNLPPEEIDIVKEGNHYGWPFCYGNRVPDSKYSKQDFCKTTSPPVFQMQAHSAPLGLTFYTGQSFPEEYRGDLFVAFHGSWNRSVPTGYKVVRIMMKDGRPVGIEDFATGWLEGQRAWGTPVDLVVGPDGSLYVSDDRGGIIYRITYGK